MRCYKPYVNQGMSAFNAEQSFKHYYQVSACPVPQIAHIRCEDKDEIIKLRKRGILSIISPTCEIEIESEILQYSESIKKYIIIPYWISRSNYIKSRFYPHHRWWVTLIISSEHAHDVTHRFASALEEVYHQTEQVGQPYSLPQRDVCDVCDRNNDIHARDCVNLRPTQMVQ